jgi:hypothetical protein
VVILKLVYFGEFLAEKAVKQQLLRAQSVRFLCLQTLTNEKSRF